MNRLIFVNLPVADLARSRTFYAGLGFAVDPRFSDDRSVCVIISAKICVMLVGRDRYPAGRASNSLSAISRDEVDQLVARALANGGSPWRDRVDEDGMYGHSFADPDGHVWELLHLEFCGGL